MKKLSYRELLYYLYGSGKTVKIEKIFYPNDEEKELDFKEAFYNSNYPNEISFRKRSGSFKSWTWGQAEDKKFLVDI